MVKSTWTQYLLLKNVPYEKAFISHSESDQKMNQRLIFWFQLISFKDQLISEMLNTDEIFDQADQCFFHMGLQRDEVLCLLNYDILVILHDKRRCKMPLKPMHKILKLLKWK